MDKIKNKLEKEGNKKGGNDKRFLNYFDLESNKTMTIRLMPDGGDSEELWLEYSTHGGNLKNPMVDRITCANMNDEKCPACSYSYGLWQNDEKDEAKKWRNKTTYISQCIVIESPIEINQSDDGNMIKLIYLPFGIKEVIKEAIINGTIEDPTEVDFVIKKTKNSGGYSTYDKSFFKTKESDIPTEVLNSIGDGTSYLYDISDELPEIATAAEVKVWLDKTIDIVEGVESAADIEPEEEVEPVSSKLDDSKEETEEKPDAKALMEKLKNRNRGKQ